MNPVGAGSQAVPWHFGPAGLLGIFVVVGSGKWKRIVAPRILTFVGAISYGLYLCHLFFLIAYQWVAKHMGFEQRWNLDVWQRTWMPFTINAAVVFSYLSRWYFEEPFLRLEDRWEKPAGPPAALKIEPASQASGAVKT